VLPDSVASENTVSTEPSATTSPSLIETRAEVPLAVVIFALPAWSKPEMLESIKPIFIVELGSTSKRPSLPRLTTALDPLAVDAVLPEINTSPVAAGFSSTVTFPTTVSFPVSADWTKSSALTGRWIPGKAGIVSNKQKAADLKTRVFWRKALSSRGSWRFLLGERCRIILRRLRRSNGYRVALGVSRGWSRINADQKNAFYPIRVYPYESAANSAVA
jgi:hypothetical protein